MRAVPAGQAYRCLVSALLAAWLQVMFMAAASVKGEEIHSIAGHYASNSSQALVKSLRERESMYSLLDDLGCSASPQDASDEPLDDKKCRYIYIYKKLIFVGCC